MATAEIMPAPPPGFTLDEAEHVPPPPTGFTMDAAPSAPAEHSPVTTGERIAGFPLTRLAMGAVSPVIGAAQLGAHAGDWLNEQMGIEPVVSPAIDTALQEFETAKKKGMDYWAEKTGITAPSTAPDWFGLAGTLGTGGVATKGLAIPKTSLGRVGQGAKIGATMGATTPVLKAGDRPPDFLSEKATQTGLGAVTGGAIPGVLEAGKGLGKLGGQFADLVRPSGPSNILTTYQRKIIGEPQIPAVQQALRNVEEIVAGSKPTAAEALVGVPEGSPIQAHQKVIASMPGGPSATFGARALEQEAAKDAAWAATEGLTAPMREAALTAANAKGGVPIRKLQANLYDIAQEPGVQGVEGLSRVLLKTREKIASIATPLLKIDATDLYRSREELGKVAQRYYKAGDNFSYGKVRDAQRLMDDAIESVSGSAWKQYLSTFAAQAKRIEQAAERQAEKYKPAQPTTLASAVKSSEVEALPHLLSRPLVVGNYILGLIRGDIEPAIEAEAARRYLNPKALASALDKKPAMIEPEVWNALVQQASTAGAVAVAKGPDHTTHARAGAQALGATP
jgi:hypothetical protein